IGGGSQQDADTDTDRNGDGITLGPVLSDPNLPKGAKMWALAQELNTQVAADVFVPVAFYLKSAGIPLARAIARGASHETGHEFGLQDAYTEADPAVVGPGTAGCDADGNCKPYDVMESYSTDDTP